jgi:hypothetical protein
VNRAPDTIFPIVTGTWFHHHHFPTETGAWNNIPAGIKNIFTPGPQGPASPFSRDPAGHDLSIANFL